MKKKRLLFAFGTLAFLLYACVQDALFTDEQQELPNELAAGKNRELSVAAAKEWYVNNGSPVTRMGVTQSNVSGILVTPSWNHAKEWKKGKYEVVEASLRSNMNVILYDEETKIQKKKMSKKEKGRVMNVARTVILKDITTGEIITFNMIFIGSLNYLMKHDDLSDNNYLHRVPHFDGMVLYFCPSGEFVNGWKYKNGKIIKRLSPVLDDEMALLDTLSSVTTRSMQCYTNYYTESYYYCPPTTRSAFMDDWATFYGAGEFGGGIDYGGGGNSGGDSGGGPTIDGGELDGPTITAPSCYWTSREVPYTECIDDGSSDGGGGGYIGNPTDPSAPTKSHVEKIIKNADRLNSQQLEKLEKAIEEMEKKICYAKQIINYLESEGFTFNSVYMNPNLGGGMAGAGNSVSSNGTVDLVFRGEDDITYGTFAHELVHLFQIHLGVYSGTISRGMMEYERALIDDIMYYSKIKGNKKLSDAWYEKALRSPFVYGEQPWDKADLEEWDKSKEIWKKKQAKYLKWLRGLTKKGTPSSISSDDFKEWISLFSNQNRPYIPDRGYDYTIDYAPKALKKVLELASSCY